ncbi:tetratricopeptide repeat protein, partial [Patescibacteria group bacterium]|nr:tetratricopeptide repeat protein [Patescibacteria group bacterium]
DEEIAEYKKAIEINPEYSKAHNNLGLAYYYKKMLDEAIAEYKKAIEIDPEYSKAHYNLAMAYYEKKEYSLAIKYCDRATELGYRTHPEFLELLKPYREISVSEGAPVLKASPSWVKPGERIFLRFSDTPGNNTDWISIYPVGGKSEKYGQWYYLKEKTSGELTFTAPEKEGDYEFRLFANWPEGGYEAITTSNVVRVDVSVSPKLYRDVFHLSTGELIIGELLSFDGSIFKIETEEGVIEKRKNDIMRVFFGTKSLSQ